MKRLPRLFRAILHARSGLAALEFALILPFLTITGLYGTEMAWYMLVNMRASQVAMQIADNASRIGDTSALTNRKIYESDINDIMIGANLDGGSMMNLLTNGRVIVSSLEVDSGNNQYIHWQRCKGVKNVASSYGISGDLKPGGMGPTGHKISAMTGDAAIFVELVYDYQPLFSSRFISNRTITALASFNVRDSRDLTQIYQTNPVSTVSSCSTFSAT